MKFEKGAAWSLTVARVLVGLLFVYQGWQKVIDPASVSGFFQSLGLFGFLGPVVGYLEVIAGILLIVGLWTTWASITIGVIMVGALVLVQFPNNGFIDGLFGRDMLILAITFVLASNGSGELALDKEKKSRKLNKSKK